MLIEQIIKDAIDEYVTNRGMTEQTSNMVSKYVEIMRQTGTFNHYIVLSRHMINIEESSNLEIIKDENNTVQTIISKSECEIVFNKMKLFNNYNGYIYDEICFNMFYCIPTQSGVNINSYILTKDHITGLDEEIQVDYPGPGSFTLNDPEFEHCIKIQVNEGIDITNCDFILCFGVDFPSI